MSTFGINVTIKLSLQFITAGALKKAVFRRCRSYRHLANLTHGRINECKRLHSSIPNLDTFGVGQYVDNFYSRDRKKGVEVMAHAELGYLTLTSTMGDR